MTPAYPVEEELDSNDLEEIDAPSRSPSDSGVRWSEEFASRAQLEQRLQRRGRFALQHRNVPLATLKRLDAMFDSLTSATTIEDAVCVLRSAFTNEAEQRAALVPLLALLSPMFDEKMPTRDVLRLIAHHEMRSPALAIS